MDKDNNSLEIKFPILFSESVTDISKLYKFTIQKEITMFNESTRILIENINKMKDKFLSRIREIETKYDYIIKNVKFTQDSYEFTHAIQFNSLICSSNQEIENLKEYKESLINEIIALINNFDNLNSENVGDNDKLLSTYNFMDTIPTPLYNQFRYLQYPEKISYQKLSESDYDTNDENLLRKKIRSPKTIQLKNNKKKKLTIIDLSQPEIEELDMCTNINQIIPQIVLTEPQIQGLEMCTDINRISQTDEEIINILKLNFPKLNINFHYTLNFLKFKEICSFEFSTNTKINIDNESSVFFENKKEGDFILIHINMNKSDIELKIIESDNFFHHNSSLFWQVKYLFVKRCATFNKSSMMIGGLPAINKNLFMIYEFVSNDTFMKTYNVSSIKISIYNFFEDILDEIEKENSNAMIHNLEKKEYVNIKKQQKILNDLRDVYNQIVTGN